MQTDQFDLTVKNALKSYLSAAYWAHNPQVAIFDFGLAKPNGLCIAQSLVQWFPTCLGLRHPAEENYILRHPVANPYNFASRFDDSFKMYFY